MPCGPAPAETFGSDRQARRSARTGSAIGAHPATGSARHAFELDLPGLRSWPLARYPHLIFYVERADHIDVWRVLHGKRDIARWMRKPADSDDP